MRYDDNPFGLLEERRSQVENVRENSTRFARSFITWTTKGIGESIVREARYFNVSFIEEPIFTSGFVLDDDGPDPVAGHFPRAQAGVWGWVRDNRGFYTGVYVYFVVDTIGPGQVLGDEPNYIINHHLLFEGNAIKDVPAHLVDF